MDNKELELARQEIRERIARKLYFFETHVHAALNWNKAEATHDEYLKKADIVMYAINPYVVMPVKGKLPDCPYERYSNSEMGFMDATNKMQMARFTQVEKLVPELVEE